jgi:hypothetical protein
MFAETKVCSYYDEAACQEDVSACNKTEEYCEYSADKPVHCYHLTQQNESGEIELVKRGCWLGDYSCIDQKSCEAVEDEDKKHLYFCCCEGDYCNRNITYIKNTGTKPPELHEPEVTNNDEVISTLLFSVLPLLAIAVLVVFGYWLYRRHRTAFHETLPQPDPDFTKTDITSVESPLLLDTPTGETCSSIQLLEVKARGRFGCVWKAQLQENHIIAVKEFPIQDQESFITERDFYNLPQINAHPNILRFISSEKRGTNINLKLWLVCEYHDHGSLYDYLKAHTLSGNEMMRIAISMARGLAFLHEDVAATKLECHKPAVAHRDFKSKNVLIKADLSACIADFGLALKFEPGKCVGDTHGQVGTRRYMAPEVLEGAINFSRDSFLRIDMYAAGLVMWELASRCTSALGPVEEYRLPFEAEVGQHPTLDDMQDAVVTQKLRPALKKDWSEHAGLAGLKDTMEECWDHDPEARLSAGCVEERLKAILPNIAPTSPNTAV